MAQDVLLSVLVPVYNERQTVKKLIDRVRAVPLRKEIILVDDASSDGTADILRQIVDTWGDDPMNSVKAIFKEQNAGKGAAIRSAIAEVTGDIALVQDADLEYNPADYPALLEPILRGDADIVYGSRFLTGPRRVLFFRHTMGNKLLTFLSNLCTDLNLTDMETCYKVFRTDILKRLHLRSDRFGIEPEITAKLSKMGCRIYEVPISYHGREYWEGKKIGWKDGFSAVWTILRYWLTDDQGDSDPGFVSLQRLRHAKRYNDWVWGLLTPHVGNRVLEVGCGVGNFTCYLRNRDHVLATDNNQMYLDLLQSTFERFDNIAVRSIDWEDPDIETLRSHHFDTVLCLNVLEHIESDVAALETFASLLDENGRVVLQVPAMQSLYGEIDRAIGHFRRYEKEDLKKKLEDAGFVVEHMRYFNVPGIFGWFLNARVLGRRTVPGLQARLVNFLVPLLRLEQMTSPPFGMALIAVARKPADHTSEARSFQMPVVDALH